jgi:glycosyltransferase involved in cell wall biosynthesis
MRRNGSSARARTLAILFPSTGYGGAEHYVQVIATAAIGDGWSVHAAFPQLPATEGLRGDLLANGVVCHAHAPHRNVESTERPVAAVRFLLAEVVGTISLLRAIRADSVMVMLPHPLQFDGAVLAATVFARRRAVMVFQLVSDSLTISGAHRLVYRAARSLGGHWICVSRANQHWLARSLNWSTDAIRVIPNGVPTNRPSERDDGLDPPPEGARDSLIRECGLPPDTSLLLTAGRFTSQKAHDVIARSIPGVLKRAPRTHWIWAGDGPLRAKLVQLLADLGVSEHVHLLGFRDDMRRLLSAADLFLLPSRAEGQPFALLEAAASGLPVLASDIPPIREFVRNRETGILVAVDDAGALADATVWAIEHPGEMEAMAARARDVAECDYSEQGMIVQTLALLDTR